MSTLKEQRVKRDDGASAFPGFEFTEGFGPTRRNEHGELEHFSPGMTLRDYFAGQALLIAVQALATTPSADPNLTPGQRIAEIAYAIAGRMIQERAK